MVWPPSFSPSSIRRELLAAVLLMRRLQCRGDLCGVVLEHGKVSRRGAVSLRQGTGVQNATNGQAGLAGDLVYQAAVCDVLNENTGDTACQNPAGSRWRFFKFIN